MLLQGHATGELSTSPLEIAAVSYPELEVTILERSSEILDAPTPIDRSGQILWQRMDGEEVNLVRGSGDQSIRWPITGMAFLDLDASSTTVLAAQVREIGQDANEVDLLRIDLERGFSPVVVDTVTGLQAQWLSGDGEYLVRSVQRTIAGPITFEVHGDDDWSVTVADALASPLAMSSDGSRVLYRKPWVSTIESVDRDGVAGPSPIGAIEVLAFDLSSSDVIAYGSANFTGGDGALCFKKSA